MCYKTYEKCPFVLPHRKTRLFVLERQGAMHVWPTLDIEPLWLCGRDAVGHSSVSRKVEFRSQLALCY